MSGLVSQRNVFELYERYLVPALFAEQARVLIEQSGLKAGERVLDVACGTGIVTRQVAPIAGKQGSVIGLDMNPAMLAMARTVASADGAPIEWKEGSALSLPIPDSSVDVVFCQQGLQFFPDKLQAIKEMRRVLAPGGRAIISVFQGLDKHPVYQKFNEVFVRHLGVPAITAPFTFGDPDELQALLSQAGFSRTEVIPTTLIIQFASLEAFIEGTVVGSAAAVAALQNLDADKQNEVIEKSTAEMREYLLPMTDNGVIVFPMTTNLGRAFA